MVESRMYRFMVLLTLAMCLALIITSSLMHIGNIGMGSVDWPASYGLIGEHDALPGISAETASDILPATLIERAHRAIASFLQLLIIAVFILALRQRKSSDLSMSVPMLGLALSLFLAFLGVWFGSPLRYPAVVILNLIGGIGLLALYWWLTLDIYARAKEGAGKIRTPAVAALLVLITVIILGAWTDAYYAALACKSFPDCQGQWLPGVKLWEGLSLLGTLDVDAHGRAIIDAAVAENIHMAHRLGSLLAFFVIAGLGIRALGMGRRYRVAALAVLLLLVIQIVLGVAAVISQLTMMVVVGHSILSALLIISILTLIHKQNRRFLQKKDV